ncbi:MAG: glucosylglycerol-phosphate synthase [Gemmatimonadota bacterium]
MILATDLDGTFLGGSDADRALLYETIRTTPDATLVFVTGRGVGSILPLLSDPSIPNPDYIIADVGATVVDGTDLTPIAAVQDPIERRWPGTEVVRRALAPFEGLVYQDVPQERRCSFLIDEGGVPPELPKVVEEELGCDLLLSLDLYLDVLPRGVSKGSTLLQLIEHLGMDRERVVVAGDTLNDLSLFECQLKGVVVGEAEPALRDRVAMIGSHCYLADSPGGGGILEGLMHHGVLTGLDRPARAPATVFEPDAPAAIADGDESQLIMVYHRLPYDEVRKGDTTERRPPKSPNGIIPTLLGFFETGRKGLWVGWAKRESRNTSGMEHLAVDPERYPNLEAAPIGLTPEDVNLFYEAFSKEAFWPVIFSFPDKARFNSEHWKHYLEINQLFAKRTAELADEGAIVWIHDYNLWMVPGYLRAMRPDLKIAFFHHTAFPASDIFNIIPWRREIIDSLLQCDYVGFHIPRYVENFVDAVRSHVPMQVIRQVPCTPRFLSFGCALGVDEVTREIEVTGRRVRVGAHPVGIDVGAIRDILAKPRIQKQMERIRSEMGDRTIILSVERLDYVKGPLEKLHAFERLLDEHPELHGKVVLLTVCTPPAPGMRIYRNTRERVDQAVGRINGRFSTIDWTPVRYFFRSLPYEQVIAHYAISDVAWITPLRDGLNMVAKEYIAANHLHEGTGTLVLSEFAGASAELHGALLTNPYAPEQMAIDLHSALTMPLGERRTRLEAMFDIVDANNIEYWSYEFLAAVDGRL